MPVSSVGDKAVHTYIQCGDGSRILVWNLAGAALILYCPEHMKPEEFPPGVERAIGAISTGKSRLAVCMRWLRACLTTVMVLLALCMRSTACFWIASMGR